jgi:hypothetical protein
VNVETLVDVLKDPTRVDAVVADGVKLIEEEVGSKGGLTGMALKAGYKTVKALKPGIIADALKHLLPDFAPAVDPHYATARAAGDVRGYFTRNADRIADSLLAVTDAKGARAKNAVIKRAYDGLRPQAKKHTAEAMPRLADLVSKHVK